MIDDIYSFFILNDFTNQFGGAIMLRVKETVMNRRSIINQVNPPPCENPEWCPRCSFAAHCHEQRIGEPHRILWPGLALALFVGLGLLLA